MAGLVGICIEIINNYHIYNICGVFLRLFILIISLCARRDFLMSKKQLISAENIKVGFVSHDEEFVRQIATDRLCVKAGGITRL